MSEQPFGTTPAAPVPDGDAAELAALRAENAKLRAQIETPPEAAPAEAVPAAPTHDLLLANGDLVEHYGAIPTHVAVGDRTFPVLSVSERPVE